MHHPIGRWKTQSYPYSSHSPTWGLGAKYERLSSPKGHQFMLGWGRQIAPPLSGGPMPLNSNPKGGWAITPTKAPSKRSRHPVYFQTCKCLLGRSEHELIAAIWIQDDLLGRRKSMPVSIRTHFIYSETERSKTGAWSLLYWKSVRLSVGLTHTSYWPNFSETVMSVLLPTFHFDRTGDIVDWRLGITLSPYVRGREGEGPQVPMKVSLM